MKPMPLLLVLAAIAASAVPLRAEQPQRNFPVPAPNVRRELQPFQAVPHARDVQAGETFEVLCEDIIGFRVALRTFAFTCSTGFGHMMEVRAQRVWDSGTNHDPAGLGHIYEDHMWLIATSQAVSMFMAFRQAHPAAPLRMRVTGFYSRFPIVPGAREAVASTLEFFSQ